MKSGIIIDVKEIEKLNINISNKNLNRLDKDIKKFIKKIDEEDFNIKDFISGNIIDVTLLSEKVFSTEKEFDFFISYSYLNVEPASKLAYYLSELGFNVFVDNQEWGSVYSLLKKFDDEICCCSTNKNLYSYKLRNITTANIYSMLSIALTKVIGKSKYFILVKSEAVYKEVKPASNNETSKKYTTSPWLEHEIEIFNLIIKYDEFHKKYSSKINENIGAESQSVSWQREYNIENKYFSFLYEDDLIELKECYYLKGLCPKEILEKKLEEYLINNYKNEKKFNL